ncbi:MAG: multidrug efflux SMR transporter [Phycisphaerae bacterium]
MAWTWLTIAGLFEIAWVIGLKLSNGFTRPIPSAVTVFAMIASMWLLGLATRTLPIGTAYAVWTGIGAAGAAIAGILLFQEPRTALRIACIAAIILGVAGLRANG